MEFNAVNLERTVLEFYRFSGSETDRQKKNEWLMAAQMSPQAWQFAWELATPAKNPEVQFFGASTLATKVSKCFQEVPEAEFQGLRERLVSLFRSYIRGPKVVTTRMAVAVASLLIHSIPNPWNDPVNDVISLLQQDFQSQGISALGPYLELLTIIPEEFQTLVMTSSRRNLVRNKLSESFPAVLGLIGKIFEDKKSLPSESVVQGVKCLHAWVTFGSPPEITEDLVNKLLELASDEELFDSTMETISALTSHPNMHSHPLTIKKIIPKLLTLENMLVKLLNEESYDYALPLANLFITFGENHSRLLLDWTSESEEGKYNASKIVSIILQISSCKAQYPVQETLSEIPFGFWYIFQDDIIACEPQQYQHCVGVFGSAYQTLVESLLKKSMYSLNESGWTSDQKELFRCYRTDVADTIMYCHNILRDDLLQLLNNHLDMGIDKCRSNMDLNWPYLEACLYSWSAIGESMAEEEENPLVVQFLAKLPSIPYNNNVKVISSSLDCIGGFAEWLANYPNLVVHLIPIITSVLDNPELSLSATMALKDMARDCTEALKPLARDIIASCCTALNSNRLRQGECIRLMYPIGKMVSMFPEDQVLPQLEPILMPHMIDLQNQISQPPSVPVRNKLLFIFKLLRTLFQALSLNKGNSDKVDGVYKQQSNQTSNPNHPISVLMPQLLPLLKECATKWVHDEEVMESIWTYLKFCIAPLMENSKHMMGGIVELMSSCFSIHPQAAAIDLARFIILLSQDDQELKGNLIALIARMSMKTMSCLQENANPSEFSELVATLLQNMGQLLKKNPDYFSPQGVDLNSLVLCAIFSLSLPESAPVKYSSFFLTSLISLSPEHPYFQQILLINGEKLFQQTMTCIGSERSRVNVEFYSDIIFAMNKKFFEEFCKYLHKFVKTDNFPSDKIGKTEKENYANLLMKERTNKRKVTEYTGEFALQCLGLKS